MLKMKKSDDLTYKYDPFFDTRPQFVIRGSRRKQMYAVHKLNLRIKREDKVSNIELKINVEKYAAHKWQKIDKEFENENKFFFHSSNLMYFVLSFFGRLCQIKDYDIYKDKIIKDDIYSFIIEATIIMMPFSYRYKNHSYIVKKGDKVKSITQNKDELTTLSCFENIFILIDKEDDLINVYRNYFKIIMNSHTAESFFQNLRYADIKKGQIYSIDLDKNIDYYAPEYIIRKFGYIYNSYNYNVNPLAELFLYSKDGNNVEIIFGDSNLSNKLFKDNQIDYHNRLTIICNYYATRKFNNMMLNSDSDYYEATKNSSLSVSSSYNEMIETLKKFDAGLISILSAVFLDNGSQIDIKYLKNIYYNLLYIITDEFRNDRNVLYERIVDWYKDSKNWDDLAKIIGFYSPFKTLNGNYKAINLLLYSINQYSLYVNRENYISNFLDIFINGINAENWKEKIFFLSDFEIIEIMGEEYKRKLDQMFLEDKFVSNNKPVGKFYIRTVFKDFIMNRSIWSIYRKKKCLNDNVMNVMMGTSHAEDDKEGNLLSYGYFKYDCYVMEDLWEVWRIPGNLEQKGFINPDYIDPETVKKLDSKLNIGSNNKELFSYVDIKSLINYLKNNIKDEDKPKYVEFVNFLEDNIEYSNADKLDISKNGNLLNKINQDDILYFFSMILCLTMKVRYWGIVNWKIPYSKDTISENEYAPGRDNLRNNSARTFFEDLMYPWLVKQNKNVLKVLLKLINIQPTYLDEKEFSKYKPDRREGSTKIPKNVVDMTNFLESLKTNSSDSCKIIKYNESDEIYEVGKNTLFGRIVHGLFQSGSCFGVNGDLLIDNLKIYNELYFKYSVEDYDVILTENVKHILPGKLKETDVIYLNKFEYTHSNDKNVFKRNVGLEDSY